MWPKRQSQPKSTGATNPHPGRDCNPMCDATDQAHGYGAVFIATAADATRVSYATLLAAYRAEQTGSTEALTYAQHIAERLIADDLFARLAALRDLLSGLSCGDAAVDALNEILGEE